MNVLKSILLSSALVTTMFGADAASRRLNELNAYPPTRKTHRAESSAAGNKALPPQGKGGRFVRVKRSLAALGEEAADPEAKTHRAEAAAETENVQYFGMDGWMAEGVLSFVPGDALQTLGSHDPSLKELDVYKTRELLRLNWGNIVASLLCSNTPVHDVMTANGFDDPRYLMKTIGIEEDMFEGRKVGRYEHTDRKDIAAKLSTYAEKTVITAADIAKGTGVNDGDVVMLSYDDMVTYKTALDCKDIHLCVDVHADENGVLVFDSAQLPKGLKKLHFQNTAQDVTSIWHDFLCGCTGLTHVDLSAFTKVTSIGHDFLCGCTGLTRVDLSPLSKVTSIGSFFLSNCSGLTHLDLSPLSKVTTIGEGFLYECKELSSVDLSPLSNVTSIGRRFLALCIGLTEIKVRKGQRARVEERIDNSLKDKIVVVD